ncbi:MAG: GGDEF domain-containing protein [Candidatus Contendobacter sp.]|jgi:diguanylate cyclase (GGDEF)-like protein|nr:GGDEF domain-containing protein [Gammaproteobacteria bacterium]MCC8994393.1 GGDEF domain-containing protein [Candidatus Contendobacter sp.]
METNLMRFFDLSVKTFALAGVWRGASAMVANGAMTEPLGLLQTLEPFTIPATLLAVIGSVAATQIGIRSWRRFRRVLGKEGRVARPQPAREWSPADHRDQLIADLQNQVIELHQEKEHLSRILAEKSASLRRDPLTGIANRLAYEERLQQEFLRWKRFGHPLTLLVWDIDHFKQVNDNHGHAVGDAVLRKVAQQLASYLRITDFVARFGGEEFVMLLPGADTGAALHLAEQIRRQIAASGADQSHEYVPVTISCGVSRFEPDDSLQSVFKRADQALYQAKRDGRNCCRVGRNDTRFGVHTS